HPRRAGAPGVRAGALGGGREAARRFRRRPRRRVRARQGAGGADAAHRRAASGPRDNQSRIDRADAGEGELMTLEGKVALGTGASRGIGQAIAIALAKEGALVAGTATSAAGAESIGQYLAAGGFKGIGTVMNVNDAAQVEAAVTAVQEQLGDIGILVNNAGITRDNLLVRMKDDEWDEIMATDLKSVYRLSRLVLGGLVEAPDRRGIRVTPGR